MMSNRVWLNGARSGEHHLLDVPSGRVVTTLKLGAEVRKTAGMGRFCARRFVSVYVGFNREAVLLQVDQSLYPLDGLTSLSHRTLLGGLQSRLVISRTGSVSQVLQASNLAGAVLRRFDPGYDALDASLDDFLADLHDIASSPRRLDWIREIKDPMAGPWELLT